MKRRWLSAILAAMLCVPTGGQAEQMQEESIGMVCVETATIYADSALTKPVADVAYGCDITYDSGAWDAVSAVQIGETTGYMPRTHIGIPAEGEWQGYDTGVVLCQTLSLRTLPTSASERLGVLETGDRFVILAEENGFYLAAQRIHDENLENAPYDQTGWVNAAYTAKNMGTLTATGTVHARAYGDENAPLVAEIERGTLLNLIAHVGDYYVVSLRGASAFIHVDEKIALDDAAKTATETM